ncbi:hypothetical protein Kpol_1032p46 [Vanderwaltozyma polyspora DSM 70294]|uniref:Pre-mRNA-splicing factor SLU7 n=1 Tax=Vanderwaltozyma polyspora (strain ATCC 22028 / DSM 70294 / BCRC 21397 / CBS 2163 / NBRC 10782 / NRRL Y-8283 / UCD 57-17) TaxID=436907 RepID=A7TH00_VANPO|nr:uncharacterized protein Kpol_1032p46 [Vanderwaltozyma polyspora DSM 70294]EDO18452.1 hypothetical protein Kpol_1032p46 [Vanderwaltozyma polyspora DSM 70294]
MKNRRGNSRSRGRNDSSRVNEHIPRYIRNQPWYYKDGIKQTEGDDDGEGKDNEKEDYLIHHRQSKGDGALDIDNNAEPKVGGGIQDIFDKVSVKESENNDDVSEQTANVRRADESTSWDARKDRWYGYAGQEYDQVLAKWEGKLGDSTIDEYGYPGWDTDEEIELEKLELPTKNVSLTNNDKDGDAAGARASVRLREDKAAYLQDIGSDEIKYDPKSRIYKSADIGKVDDKGHMFRRHLTGEGQEFAELNQFARKHAKESGVRDEINDKSKIDHVLIANPTKYEQLRRDQLNEAISQQSEIPLEPKLEARRSVGQPQRKKAKKTLQDMYG